VDAFNRHESNILKVHVDTLMNLVVRGIDVKRAIYVPREHACHAEILISFVAKEISAVREISVAQMESAIHVEAITNPAVETIPVMKALYVVLIANVTNVVVITIPAVRETSA
jgi:hypothetical protein